MISIMKRITYTILDLANNAGIVPKIGERYFASKNDFINAVIA